MFLDQVTIDALVRRARWRASFGLYDGRMNAANQRFIQSCTHTIILSPELHLNIIFTRDVGHHSGGWWKNPDYERCQHLSLSYRGPDEFAPHDKAISVVLARSFWPEHHRKAWIEGPYTPEGRAADVWHYRVFCNPAWYPLLPRGEVYSRERTPSDWRSFSEVHDVDITTTDAPFLLAASE